MPNLFKGAIKIIKDCGIYAIIVNGLKVYIGQSSRLKNREKEHFRCLSGNYHKNKHLQYSYNKHGKENFKWEILKYCKREDLNKWEQYYMNYYNSTNSHCGYNEVLKADGSVKSKEIREKISRSLLGRKLSPNHIQKLKEAKKGYKPPKETIEKARQVNLGKKRKPEIIEKIKQAKLMKK